MPAGLGCCGAARGTTPRGGCAPPSASGSIRTTGAATWGFAWPGPYPFNFTLFPISHFPLSPFPPPPPAPENFPILASEREKFSSQVFTPLAGECRRPRSPPPPKNVRFLDVRGGWVLVADNPGPSRMIAGRRGGLQVQLQIMSV